MTTPSSTPSTVLRSNVFGLAAWVAALFVLAAIALATLLMWRASSVLVNQVVASLEHEAQALQLEYQRHGLQRVQETMARKSEVSGPGLFYLETRDGRQIAGNLASIPDALRAGDDRGGVFRYQPRSQRGMSAPERSGVGLKVAFGAQARAIVGRDIEDIEGYSGWLRWILLAGFCALAIAAIATGYALSRALLGRLANINQTTDAIIDGDLRERVTLSGNDDEIDGVAGNINRMLDRIDQLMHGMREVSDNIAHDLKTPLNRLRNRAEGALRDPRGGPAHREGLERIIDEADALIRTFNALLLIARLESRSLEESAATFDVTQILDDVRELYEPVAEEYGLEIKTSAPSPVLVHANQQLIVQATANLIDNAIKYGRKRANGSDAHGALTVDVSQSGSDVVIRVGDRGPGIPAEDRARVLDRFVRLERSRTEPGTGLGLSLVAAVARMHGGTVELSDNAPGLAVTLRIPRLIQPIPQTQAAELH